MIVSNVDNIKKIRVNIFFDSEFNFTFRLLLLTFYVIFSFILLENSWKRKIRVEKTKVFIQESVHSKITIDWISQLAKFSSRSNFYSAIKEKTGITPSHYLKSIIGNNTDNNIIIYKLTL